MIIDLLILFSFLLLVFTAGAAVDAFCEWRLLRRYKRPVQHTKRKTPLDYYTEWEKKIMEDEDNNK